VYVVIVKIYKKINNQFRMHEAQSKKKEFIIVVYHKNDVIAKNHSAKKNIVNVLTREYYAHKPVNA
jgi:hypothetical protein